MTYPTWSLVAILLLTGYSLPCDAYKKVWIYDWNIESDQNWRGANSICGNNDAVFPDKLDFTTFVGSSKSFRSLVLPKDGEMVFGEVGELIIGSNRQEESKPGCSNSDRTVTWSRVGQDKWWDSQGWLMPTELLQNSSAVPDVHRVPCTTDVAVFLERKKHLYPVHFTPPEVRITAVTIGEKNYSTSELLDFVSVNLTGVFTGSSSGDVLLYAEDDPICQSRDCVCNKGSNAKQTVCSSRNSPCPPVLCDTPIVMEGFCCETCGADVKLPTYYAGNKNLLESAVGSVSRRDEFKGISSYVGLMDDQQYHVFLTPRHSEGDYEAAAKLLINRLAELLDGPVSAAVTVTTAGMSVWQQDRQSQSTVTTVIVCLLVVTLVVISIYVYRRREHLIGQSSANFNFRRLSMTALRRLSRVSLQGGIEEGVLSTSTGLSTVSSFSSDSGLRFSNPVFSKSTASLAAMPIDPDNGVKAEEGTSQENPMYRAYEHMTPEEQQAAEDAASTPAPPKPPRIPTVEISSGCDSGIMRFKYLDTIEEDTQYHSTTVQVNCPSQDNSIAELIECEVVPEIKDIDERLDQSQNEKNDIEDNTKIEQSEGETKIIIEVPGMDIKSTNDTIHPFREALTEQSRADNCGAVEMLADISENPKEEVQKVEQEEDITDIDGAFADIRNQS